MSLNCIPANSADTCRPQIQSTMSTTNYPCLPPATEVQVMHNYLYLAHQRADVDEQHLMTRTFCPYYLTMTTPLPIYGENTSMPILVLMLASSLDPHLRQQTHRANLRLSSLPLQTWTESTIQFLSQITVLPVGWRTLVLIVTVLSSPVQTRVLLPAAGRPPFHLLPIPTTHQVRPLNVTAPLRRLMLVTLTRGRPFHPYYHQAIVTTSRTILLPCQALLHPRVFAFSNRRPPPGSNHRLRRRTHRQVLCLQHQ